MSHPPVNLARCDSGRLVWKDLRSWSRLCTLRSGMHTPSSLRLRRHMKRAQVATTPTLRRKKAEAERLAPMITRFPVASADGGLVGGGRLGGGQGDGGGDWGGGGGSSGSGGEVGGAVGGVGDTGGGVDGGGGDG